MSSRAASSACSKRRSVVDSSAGRAWGIAIVAGLALAAAMIVLPRPLLFEEAGRNACEEAGAEYVGLASAPGRYGDPVPDGARCLAPGNPSPIEVEADFFGDGAGGATLAWLYRLACIILPLAVALAIGSRLGRPHGAHGGST